MKNEHLRPIRLAWAGIWALAASAAYAAPPPAADQMLAIKPAQRFVDYDTPPPGSAASLKTEVVREGRATGWVLKDSAGRIYRRFMDTNQDNVVDQRSYYQNGIEVYREIDSNSNGRADQFRWLNTAGTRWGIDNNEDGRIDAYRVLSAEEASREAVRALASKDYSVLEPVLVNAADSGALAGAVPAEKIRELATQGRPRFTESLTKLSHLNGESHWLRFDGGIPMLIPGDAADGSRDVTVYHAATAAVQTGERIDLIQLGDLVLVNRVWKLTEVPTPLPPNGGPIASSNSVFHQLGNDPSAAAAEATDPELQNLLGKLQKLDEGASRLSGSQMAAYHLERAGVLEKLAERSKAAEERAEWQRQLADSLVAALQFQATPEIVSRLERLSASVQKQKGDSNLAAYIAFRELSADYSRKMQQPASDFVAIQKEWLEKIKKYVADYPRSDDAPEALAQLASGLEFTGNEDQARPYYQKLVSDFPKSPLAARAAGALRRMDLVGKPFVLRGTDLRGGTIDAQRYNGKVVLVGYWATWCEPCKSDIARLKQLYDKFHSTGFEIISISVDQEKQEAARYAQGAGMSWPVLFETGGLDSPPAAQYGIITLPSYFLIDAQGKVLSRTVQVSQLEDDLKKLLSKDK